MTASKVLGRTAGHRRRPRGWAFRVALPALVLLAAAGCMVFPDGSFTTTDPVAGEPSVSWNDPDDGLVDAPIELTAAGYVEEEHFIGGPATAYGPVGPWLPDGRWQAQPTTSARFLTRILVRRPADPDAFNGVVVVEWLNVTSGRDLDGVFRPTHTELLDKGYAWVGVSVQKVGVDDLKRRDPDRYAALNHPGDNYAYDILTRAGRIVADPASPVLGGLHPEVVLAAGASQSASGLLTYVNAVQPVAGVYDGFLLVSHLGGGMALSTGAAMPPSPIVRTDGDAAVLDVQLETDLVVFRTHLNRQDDNPRFRLWEFAGSSHIGEYGRSLTWPPNPSVPGDPCTVRINSAPAFALGKASLAALAAWTTTGVAPPSAPRLQLADPSAPDPVARDQYGNALGGIRYPHVEVPIARVDGLPNSAASSDPIQAFICRLSGRTLPFTAAQLAELYPTSEAYLGRFRAAANQGFLLRDDVKVLEAAAAGGP